MTGMTIMMVIWLLFRVYQKTNRMTQEQKNKLKSIKKSLEMVYSAVVKHVETKDPRVLALPDYGVILGTVQLLLEEEIVKGALEEGKTFVMQPPQQKTGEQEFDKPETSVKKPVTFH